MLMLIDFLPPCRAAGRCYLDGTLRDVLQIVFFFNERKRHGNGMFFLLVFVGDEAQQVDLRLSTWWAVVFRFGLGESCKNYMETNVEGMILFGHALVHYKMAHVQETQLQFWVANLVVTGNIWCCHVVCQTIHAFYANISHPARSPSLCKNFAMS